MKKSFSPIFFSFLSAFQTEPIGKGHERKTGCHVLYNIESIYYLSEKNVNYKYYEIISGESLNKSNLVQAWWRQ